MEEVHKLYEEIKKQEEFQALLARRLPRGKGKYKGKLPLKCFNCDKIGHMASNCPEKEYSEKREYRDNRKKDNQYRGHRDFRRRDRKTCLVADEVSNDDKSNETDTEEVVYVAVKDGSDEERYEEKALVTHINNNDSWIIDSGCSHHMTGDKHKFVKLEDYDGGYVRFDNDAPCLVKGKGSITLALRTLPLDVAEEVRQDCAMALRNAKPPKFNIPKAELLAFNNLMRNNDLIISRADKGNTSITMRKPDYLAKMEVLLSDSSYYKILSRNPCA
ncbi:hypothetical protein SUGI_1472430 [Cryptomeria japonica]|uniref:CCHC-type domain-containing protein n=1 Tax=Cryptomeria japonica TaxID=3369 RepID=A0AAD3NS83_CRYJA|nr:hypothetical protein SUGI_1472430 [Cryptomeria japonica]